MAKNVTDRRFWIPNFPRGGPQIFRPIPYVGPSPFNREIGQAKGGAHKTTICSAGGLLNLQMAIGKLKFAIWKPKMGHLDIKIGYLEIKTGAILKPKTAIWKLTLAIWKLKMTILKP